MDRDMAKKNHTAYQDGNLTGQEIADLIVAEWQSGHYSTIAEITSAVHEIRRDLPRSVIFWLAFHTIESDEICSLPGSATAAWLSR